MATTSPSPPHPGDPGAVRFWGRDPRSDLAAMAGDGPLWDRLLTTAFGVDGQQPNGMFGLVRGLRCIGCTLSSAPDGSLVLVPPEDLTDSQMWHEWIGPFAPRIRRTLAVLAELEGQGQPHRVGVVP